MNSPAFNQGLSAFLKGNRIEANPYNRETQPTIYRQWNDGWWTGFYANV